MDTPLTDSLIAETTIKQSLNVEMAKKHGVVITRQAIILLNETPKGSPAAILAFLKDNAHLSPAHKLAMEMFQMYLLRTLL